eukprot:Gregarina_sp_Poly_1__11250@NODE_92_length_14764_cov_231_259032_g79_i0_p10_GENE_NODE_92_length_14764_cov_231_259032_g79_i0NODE_92_length_14764_cov_231_259032_g79_i0_p10_ORF_typecomplete_len128_score29_01Cgr1/PF03879_14/3_6e15Phage_GP20/PF06810_11/0_21DUF4140/PF13600_6/0_31DUF4722/PF15849_5/0_25TRAPgamma/PF07074_12/0_86SMC_N/PF02463_19/0_78Borrelia_P83/PF05262_11/0_93Atg14/PF10186_9/1_5CEP19/PF14933_6/1_7Tho2/PF11262_8/2_3DUF737/PF05300_11/3_7DUF572/PF04502_13/4_8FAM60A/PF15396_6/5_5AAA_23/PF13476
MSEKTASRGMAVSGRPWKEVQSHRSSALIKSAKKSFEERQQEKLELKRAKQLENEMKAVKRDKRRAQNERRRLKQERKKEQQVRHAVAHQGAVFVNTAKVKKMDLKARKQLMKISPEMLQERFNRFR